VLRAWEWSETSQTVSLLCREGGLRRGLAKGSRRERSPFGGGFEAATRGEIGGIAKSSSELATLTDWDLREVFWGVRRSASGHFGGVYLLEAVSVSLGAEDPHPAVFDALCVALRGVGEGDGSAAVAWFLWRLLGEIGYRPVVGAFGGGERVCAMDPSAGRLVEDPGVGGGGGDGGCFGCRGGRGGAAAWGVFVVGDGPRDRFGRDVLCASLMASLGVVCRRFEGCLLWLGGERVAGSRWVVGVDSLCGEW